MQVRNCTHFEIECCFGFEQRRSVTWTKQANRTAVVFLFSHWILSFSSDNQRLVYKMVGKNKTSARRHIDSTSCQLTVYRCRFHTLCTSLGDQLTRGHLPLFRGRCNFRHIVTCTGTSGEPLHHTRQRMMTGWFGMNKE